MDQVTPYTGPQLFKYKIKPTEMKGGDLYPSFPTTDFTDWNQGLFCPGLITTCQPLCCISKMTQYVLEGFNVGRSERTGYLHIGKLVSASAQESCLLKFMCVGVLNVYILYKRYPKYVLEDLCE